MIDDLIFAICRGGWPRSLNVKSDRAKLEITKDLYVQTFKQIFIFIFSNDIMHLNEILRRIFMDRKLTRVDLVRNFVDSMLKSLKDEEIKRNGYVHLYGVGQAAAFLAMFRGKNRRYAELAQISGMLHDFTKYSLDEEKDHAMNSSKISSEFLISSGVFDEEEIELICNAIRNHSSKNEVHFEFDEILKDADALQHWLRNPMEEYFFDKTRIKKLVEEFSLLSEKDES